MIIPYNSQHKGVKWYLKLAELFFKFCVYNSFVLWKQLNADIRNVDNLQFRIKLIDEMISFHH